MTWYQLNDPTVIASPALLVYRDRIKSNIDEMVKVAGSAERLRPHVKTHKCREIISMQQQVGIQKFKCATVAEAEMLAAGDVADVLLAYQPTGPTASRYCQLQANYPDVKFSALVDNLNTAKQLDQLWMENGRSLGVFIDLDVGMHRTGITPGKEAKELADFIEKCAGLALKGWHIYDGHIRDTDVLLRKATVAACFNLAAPCLITDGSYEIVAGGTPTFPIHASNPVVTLSPGTSLLWDQGL